METQQVRTPLRGREALLYSMTLPAIKGSTAITAVMATADQGSLPTNGALIVAEDTVANLKTQLSGNGTLTIANQPDVCRNVVLNYHNDSGGPLDLTIDSAALSLVVTGTFRGLAQTETITATCVTANKTVATGKWRSWAGLKPFDTITSIVLATGATWAPDTMKFQIGIGCRLGLPMKPYANVIGDFVKYMYDAAAVALSAQLNADNQTFNVGTLADGKTLFLQYWTNLSDVRYRLFNK